MTDETLRVEMRGLPDNIILTAAVGWKCAKKLLWEHTYARGTCFPSIPIAQLYATLSQICKEPIEILVGSACPIPDSCQWCDGEGFPLIVH